MPGPGRPMPRGMKPTVENPGKIFKRIIGFVTKSYLPHCIVVLICIVVSVLANVQGTWFTKNLIDKYIEPLLQVSALGLKPDYSGLLGAIGRVACFYGIGIIAAYLNTRTMVYITQGTLRNLRDEMFLHMETLPIKYFDTHAHGDIMSMYTNDVDTLRQMISQSIPQLVNSVITIVSVLVSMILLNVPLTVLALLLISIMLFVTKKMAGQSSKFFIRQQKNLGAVNGFIEEMMEGQKVVKVFCHEKESIDRFTQLNDELFDSAYNAYKFTNILGPINAQIGNISYVIIAIVGGLMALNGILGFSLGSLVSF
ncbi:MAG: ABC transporter ATP-binding protein, partial [Lachnospiraceae bacterium]|nr:ABC transporter ATP-binding protein [Lachnospiraceae bacterium]